MKDPIIPHMPPPRRMKIPPSNERMKAAVGLSCDKSNFTSKH